MPTNDKELEALRSALRELVTVCMSVSAQEWTAGDAERGKRARRAVRDALALLRTGEEPSMDGVEERDRPQPPRTRIATAWDDAGKPTAWRTLTNEEFAREAERYKTAIAAWMGAAKSTAGASRASFGRTTRR
jgi:hypothetical protein